MNARKEDPNNSLDTVLGNQPPDRLAELEHRVAELEKNVALLKSVSGWPLFEDETSDKEKKKPGPKEKIGDEDLFGYRDGLILWLEPVWPWMEDRLLAAATPAEVVAILGAVAVVPEVRPVCQKRLLQNAHILLEFLRDPRFSKTLAKAIVTDAIDLPWEDERRRRAANHLPTRQIANAMAGFPELAWRTSLDRCSEQPSTAFIALNLDMHYRDLIGIPTPKGRDITGAWSLLPQPLQPVSPQSGDQAVVASNRP